MSENNIFSYTKRDYESARREGLAKIPVLSKGQWTDLNATDPGIIILDYVHALVDMINYYQDHQALETFITTAKERANIFRLAKQFSYQIRSAKGATCDVTFTSYLLYDHPVRIPKHTVISSTTGISYLTSKDAYLPANSSRVTVPCTQGVLSSLVYKGTGISRLSPVVGAANQSVLLTSTNIDIDTIVIKDSAGRIWSPVDHIVFSNSNDRSYQVDLNPDDTVTIKFGDGERGVVPQEHEELTIQYVITLADAGRVEANSLIHLEDQIKDAGQYIDFTVSNNLASVGGSKSQSSREIRELAPGVIKAQDRAVTLSDYENLAKNVVGVVAAKASDINTDPDLGYHEVRLLIVPESGSIGSVETLKSRVSEYLSPRMIPPTSLQVISPIYRPVDISIQVQSTGTYASLEYDIYSKIKDYFLSRTESIGQPFYPAEIINLVSSIPGVRYVMDMTPNSPVTLSSTEVAILGEIHIDVK